MRGYFGLGQLSAAEKSDILDQHKSLYNGYQTMQPQVSNTQPLYTYDFAGDKDGMVVNNKGEVKKYTNMGINEQVEKTEVCDECGAMRMSEGICEQCGSGKMEEATGKLDDIYDEEDLNPSAGFDYIEGPSNSVDTFEKMHKNLYKEDEYEDTDNEDDGFEDLEVGDQIDEDETDDMPYEKGKRGMKASRARASFVPTPQENEILNNLFGQYGEDIPPIVIRYLRKLPRKTLLNRLVRVGLIDKDLLQGKETIDEQGYTGGGNAPDMDLSNINPAYDFVSDGPMAGGDVYPTEGEMEEQAPEDMIRFRRRGVTYDNLLSFIDYEKTQWDMCNDFSDEFEYADNIISSAIDSFFAKTGQDYENDDFFDELHDICKDWFGEDLISGYYEECGGQEEEEEEDFMFMESAFSDEIDEVDVSGSQGIYGEMDPPYDFDSEGPGKAGPYQRTSYNEEEIDEMEVEDEEEFEIDEDLQESFHNQKNKITEMMSRMKIIK
jgi:ribosomal protein L32